MYYETFATKLRNLREKADLKQIEVSEATGIPRSTLANYELGRTQPDLENLGILIDFYETEAKWILGTKK